MYFFELVFLISSDKYLLPSAMISQSLGLASHLGGQDAQRDRGVPGSQCACGLQPTLPDVRVCVSSIGRWAEGCGISQLSDSGSCSSPLPTTLGSQGAQGVSPIVQDGVGRGRGGSYSECDKSLKDEWTGPQSTGKLAR